MLDGFNELKEKAGFVKQYVIDQLRPNDHETLRNYLDENHGPAQMGGVYWIPIEEDVLNEMQAEHVSCQPYYFALELDINSLSAELLVRTLSTVKCQCMGYADIRQRERILGFVDNLLEKLEIST